MYKRQLKFHFFIGEKKPRRTTITVDLLLFEFMALKLGVTPDSDEAHSTVRLWMRDKIISNLDDSDERKSISQYVRRILTHEIVQVKVEALHAGDGSRDSCRQLPTFLLGHQVQSTYILRQFDTDQYLAATGRHTTAPC